MFILKLLFLAIFVRNSIEFSQIVVNNKPLGDFGKRKLALLGYSNRSNSRDSDDSWITPDLIKSMLITKHNFTKYDSDFYKNHIINSDRNNYFNLLLRNASLATSTSPAIYITKSTVTDRPILVNNELETNLLKNSLIHRLADDAATTINANRVENTIREPYIYSTLPTVRLGAHYTTPIPRMKLKKKDNFEQHLDFLRKYFTFNCSIMHDLRELHDKNMKNNASTKAPINSNLTKKATHVNKGNYILNNIRHKVNYPSSAATVKTTPRPYGTYRPSTIVHATNQVRVKPSIATTVKPATLTTLSTTGTGKRPVKTVYVEPPGFDFIGNIFETFYDLVEDQLTSQTIVRKKSARTNGKGNRRKKYASLHQPSTKAPTGNEDNMLVSRTTDQDISGSTFKKKILTTNIQVTSQYVPPVTPASVNNPTTTAATKIKKKKTSTEDRSEEDDYDYLGDYTYDDGEDDDDISDEYDEDSVEFSNSKFKKNKRKPLIDSYEDEVSVETADPGGFGGFFTRVGDYFRFPSFGSSKYEEEDGRKSTTPTIEYKKPNSPTADGSPSAVDDNYYQTLQPWYYPSYFFAEANNDVETAIPASPTENPDAAEDSESWFEWNPLNLFSEDTTAAETTEASADSNWFPNFFEDETEKPSSTPATVGGNQANWMAMISQHLKTSTTKAPATTVDPLKPRKKFYDKHQLWRIYPKTEAHVKYLDDYRLSQDSSKLQWWKGPTLKGTTDVLVSPKMIDKFKDYLEYESIKYHVQIRDVQQSILYENPKITKREQTELEVIQGHPLTWYRYHRFGDILKFIYYIQRKYSKYVELIHIGESYEGKPLIVVRVAYDAVNDEVGPNSKKSKFIERRKRKQSNKPAIFIEAGAHAREWDTSAVATHMLETLVKKINSNDTEGETIRAVDWYLMPMLNPDGYEYSHLYDRLWRKTRSRNANNSKYGIISAAFNWIKRQSFVDNSGEYCFGTDLNRNWKSNWNNQVVSKDPCSDTYGGSNPFSEPETKALSKFLIEYKKNIKIYVALHSYGNFLAFPHLKSDDGNEELLEMALVSIQSLKDHGVRSKYSIDKTNEMLYKRSGSSDIYAMKELGIKYGFTLELRDKDGKGFLSSPSNIMNTAKDTFDIVKGMVDYL